MVISVVEQGGDARARVHDLIETSLQTPEEKAKLEVRADEIFATLIDSGVVVRTEVPPAPDAPADAAPDIDYALTVDLPEDFALDQPLSPFLLAALELLDPESETYTMDLISMVEATLEDPKQVLRAQERAARDRAMAEMKADGVEYEERLERIQDVTYEKPLEDLLDAAFDKYCQEVPWQTTTSSLPKASCAICWKARAILRVTFKSSASPVPRAFCCVTWQRPTVRSTAPCPSRSATSVCATLSRGSALWCARWTRAWWTSGRTPATRQPRCCAAAGIDEVVADRRGCTLLVRNALFRRVTLAAREHVRDLGELDDDWGMSEIRWQKALDAYHEQHEEILTDGDARSAAMFSIDESDEKTAHVWHVHQIFADEDGDHDFGIMGDVDLDATQDGGEVIFKNYRVGFIEDLLED